MSSVPNHIPQKSPQPQPDGKPLADGIQWFLTNEAWKLSQRRGCRRGYALFSKHAKAHPDRLEVWGIRYLGITHQAHKSSQKLTEKAPIALQRILQRSSCGCFLVWEVRPRSLAKLHRTHRDVVASPLGMRQQNDSFGVHVG